jgi:threonine dehydrogenase-like Zn-dependent dehydrogenase
VTEADDASWVGRRVVADINASCGECDVCRAGGGHHCPARTVLGIAGRDGAFADELVVPERSLVAVPPSVPDERAVFAEPLAAALHVGDEIQPGAHGRVVVLGDGKLGCLVALALRSLGREVLVVGRHEAKLAIARRAGAETRLEADARDVPRAPIVVEATGSTAGLARALELVAPRGTLVLKTTLPEAPTIDTARIVVDEVRVVGSRCGDMASAIRALELGAVDPTPLVTARYGLDDAEAAFEHASRRGALKVLIDAA